MHLFYAPKIATEPFLPEDETQHAVRVLRLTKGDKIDVVDGVGTWYKCEIANPHPKRCEVNVLEIIRKKSDKKHRLHIAIAPTKNIERFEWFVEKCTEIGIDEITPLLCQFSERKMIKNERIEKIIIAAAKQSLKTTFPVLNPMISFNDFIQKNISEEKFIAHCYEDNKKLLQQYDLKNSKATVLIGPEGDFSLSEVQNAINKGFHPVSLGSSRLRTETAGIVACHKFSIQNELF